MAAWLFGAAAGLAAAAWVAYRRRLARLRGDGLEDADVRRIIEQGSLPADEPLDLDEAAEEEERFWGESWDEPEPF